MLNVIRLSNSINLVSALTFYFTYYYCMQIILQYIILQCKSCLIKYLNT